MNLQKIKSFTLLELIIASILSSILVLGIVFSVKVIKNKIEEKTMNNKINGYFLDFYTKIGEDIRTAKEIKFGCSNNERNENGILNFIDSSNTEQCSPNTTINSIKYLEDEENEIEGVFYLKDSIIPKSYDTLEITDQNDKKVYYTYDSENKTILYENLNLSPKIGFDNIETNKPSSPISFVDLGNDRVGVVVYYTVNKLTKRFQFNFQKRI